MMHLLNQLNTSLSRIPYSPVAFLARFSIAAVFWKSGQTKIEGLAIDLVEGRFELGLPRFSDSTMDLFRDEYKLPFVPYELAAYFTTIAEHVFPVLLLFGLLTRLSALSLLLMTVVIQIFVYPGAYPLHGVWASVLLMLVMQGGGAFALDRFIETRGMAR